MHKKEYVSNFKGRWILKKQLIENIKQKVLLNAQAMLTFLPSTFEMQQRLYTYFSQKGVSFFHPFNRPLLTISSFAYQLFLSITSADIRMVKGPIHYNSSKGEIEFALFLWHTIGQHLEDGWSPEGQTKVFLPMGGPDMYDKKTKTLYYFNGCFIHGHKNCKFQKTKTQCRQQNNLKF